MFGLVMGMGIFSALSLQWARQDLAEYQKQQVARAKAEAEEAAKSLDFDILTENTQTYSDRYDLDRARKLSGTQARTMGGQDYMVTAKEDENRKLYGQAATTVAIAGSDDTLLRSQIYRSADAEEILRTKVTEKQAVAIYDTSLARDRQVRTSNMRMEAMGEQVFAFYGGKNRFPTADEFQTLTTTFGLRDAWGEPFEYTEPKGEAPGLLKFTTPWGYEQTLSLSLKDDGAEDEDAPTRASQSPVKLIP